MSQTYHDNDEGTHQATADPDWQESVFVHWYDPAAGVGGVHRIGHEPNRDGGRSALHGFVFSSDGVRFRRNDFELPLQPASSSRGFRAGGSSWEVADGRPRLRVDEPGLDADLVMENFYPLTDFFPSGGSMVDDFAAHHYETSGRITGSVRLDGREFQIDGLYHRDHSWGPRRTMTLKSHRWISGTFGPHLSFGSMCWHAADDTLIKIGYLVRDGEITYATAVDVITYLEPDGLTCRGGEVTWYLPDGDPLHLTCRQIDATVAQLHNVYYVDSICTVEYKGRTGICDFEISNNARLGTEPIGLALNAALDSGLSRRPADRAGSAKYQAVHAESGQT